MINEILKVVIEAVGSIIGLLITFAMTKYVIPWLKNIMNNTLISKSVKAAEKIYQESGMGEKKKDYVIDFLVKCKCFVKNEDGTIPEPWNTLIEAAVKELDLAENSIKIGISE